MNSLLNELLPLKDIEKKPQSFQHSLGSVSNWNSLKCIAAKYTKTKQMKRYSKYATTLK